MQSVSLISIFLIFLRLGSIGFGGPIALISLIEEECCRKRRWLELSEFNERYVFCKLLPGPIAYQMAVWTASHVRGRIGGLVAGIAFLIPAFLLILILSVSYKSVASLPQFLPAVRGMEAGAVVVIFDSIWRMFVPFVRRAQAWIFAVVATGLMLRIPRWEPLIILSGGLAMILFAAIAKNRQSRLALAPVSVALLFELFWTHFKAGATVFGTGLAVIPVLQQEVVEHFHWISNSEFLDGIAFGQITPGPVTITSVFVGHRTAGLEGAFAACLGMYLPGTLLILFVVPFVFKKLRGRAFLADFHRGAIPTVIGCLFGASLFLTKEIVTDYTTVAIVVGLAVAAARFKLPGWGLILLGSLIGFLTSFLA